MVELVVGPKGSGKTGRLVEELNALATENKNVVCIQPGKRLDKSVKFNIRLVDISEYPVNNYESLLGFVAGICSKDYDLDALYIDSIHRVAHTEDHVALLDFLKKLESFVKFKVVITLSVEEGALCHNFDAFVRK